MGEFSEWLGIMEKGKVRQMNGGIQVFLKAC